VCPPNQGSVTNLEQKCGGSVSIAPFVNRIPYHGDEFSGMQIGTRIRRFVIADGMNKRRDTHTFG
jgi:hypothetical protein